MLRKELLSVVNSDSFVEWFIDEHPTAEELDKFTSDVIDAEATISEIYEAEDRKRLVRRRQSAMLGLAELVREYNAYKS